MACLVGDNLIICGIPENSSNTLRKRYMRCPTDECITEMVVRDEGWYGVTFMCCKCGDSWNDGELLPRPFMPKWRAKRIKYHRELWDIAVFGPFAGRLA